MLIWTTASDFKCLKTSAFILKYAFSRRLISHASKELKVIKAYRNPSNSARLLIECSSSEKISDFRFDHLGEAQKLNKGLLKNCLYHNTLFLNFLKILQYNEEKWQNKYLLSCTKLERLWYLDFMRTNMKLVI